MDRWSEGDDVDPVATKHRHSSLRHESNELVTSAGRRPVGANVEHGLHHKLVRRLFSHHGLLPSGAPQSRRSKSAGVARLSRQGHIKQLLRGEDPRGWAIGCNPTTGRSSSWSRYRTSNLPPFHPGFVSKKRWEAP